MNLSLKETGWSKPALQDEVERMVADGYVTVEVFRKHLHITPKAGGSTVIRAVQVATSVTGQ